MKEKIIVFFVKDLVKNCRDLTDTQKLVIRDNITRRLTPFLEDETIVDPTIVYNEICKACALNRAR